MKRKFLLASIALMAACGNSGEATPDPNGPVVTEEQPAPVPDSATDVDALAMARLDEFSTVLLDIRAYHHRPELAEVRDRLLQFCRGGSQP